MDVQVAEQPAEGQVLVGRDMLVAEEDDASSRPARDASSSCWRLDSGWLRSMPPISAPMIGVSLSTVMVSYGALSSAM